MGGEENIVESGPGSQLIKKLIQKDGERDKAGVATFSATLLATVGSEGIESWLGTNRGAFLLVQAWETGVASVQARVKELCQPFDKVIRQKKNKGLEILHKKLSE